MTIETTSPEFRAIIREVHDIVKKEKVKKWVTQEEVEAIYSIKPTQLWELREKKVLTEKKIGSKVFISVASLDRYMAA